MIIICVLRWGNFTWSCVTDAHITTGAWKFVFNRWHYFVTKDEDGIHITHLPASLESYSPCLWIFDISVKCDCNYVIVENVHNPLKDLCITSSTSLYLSSFKMFTIYFKMRALHTVHHCNYHCSNCSQSKFKDTCIKSCAIYRYIDMYIFHPIIINIIHKISNLTLSSQRESLCSNYPIRLG